MKKTKLFTAVALIATTISLFSCKKENTENTTTSVPSSHTTVAAKGDCTPENTANLFDNAGQVHNAGLNAILPANGTIGNYNITDDQMFANANAWSMNTFGYTVSNLEAIVAGYIQDQPNVFSNVIDQANMSDISKTYAHNFNTLMLDAQSYPNPEAITYCDVKSRIVAYEKTISNANDLNDQEKKVLLQCTSIARYSVYYGWQHESTTPPTTNTGTQYRKVIIAAAADWDSFWSSWSLSTAATTSCWVYKTTQF